MELTYSSLEELMAAAQEAGRPLSQVVLDQQAQQMEQPRDRLLAEMDRRYEVMKEAARRGAQPGVRSTSGLTGGDGYRLSQAAKGITLCGGVLPGALARAVAVSEWNASMGRVVAAPTAGSCGILPAALITMEEERGVPREKCVLALFTAGAVGMVIARKASLAGAEGGCQAECGSASAMAAAALVELAGGTPRMLGHAVAIALKNVLGLVCDPVAGLVEIPCIKRNASGVANAFAAAEMALAEVESAIPADEVIAAMKRVGDAMPAALRETAEGGLAATPTGKALFERVFGSEAPAKGGCGGCGGCR